MTRTYQAERPLSVAWTPNPNSRERVLQAAAELFSRQGFDRTSMREVAELSGLGKSSLYHHIPGKQELLGEIVDRAVDQLLAALESESRAELPASERLRRAVHAHVVAYIDHRDSVACFIQEGRALQREQRDAYVAKRDRYEAWFRQIVARGIDDGEFEPTSVKLAVFALLGMCHWVVRWYRPDGEFAPEQIADHFADFAVSALARRGFAPEVVQARSRGRPGAP
jgi:AcrR family transcriptional regulator